MTIRETIASGALNTARSFGRLLGTEIVIETSQHSVATKMEHPNTNKRAWDPDLYKHGQMYYADYANPIKPVVDVNTDLEEPDKVDIEESEASTDNGTDTDSDDTDGGVSLFSDDGDGGNVTGESDHTKRHVALISSARYRKYMRQDLISQLLTPKEQWRLIAYGVLALGALQFVTIVVIMWATGSF